MMSGETPYRKLWICLALLALAVTIIGCAPRAGAPRAGEVQQTDEETGGAEEREVTAVASGGVRQNEQPSVVEAPVEGEYAEEAPSDALNDSDFAGDAGGGGATGGDGASRGAGPGVGSGESAAEESAPEYIPPAATMPPSESLPPIREDEQFQFPLQAGEIDDNEDFSAYLQYRLDFHSFLGYPVEDLDVTERHMIRVITGSGQPVLGADVSFYDGQNYIATLHTPATGTVYFFPLAYPQASGASSFEVIVEKEQTSETFTLERERREIAWEVTLDVQPSRPPVALDVLFLVDSTGSMGDEIDELKNNMLSISAQVAALPSRPDVRFGLVTYRDRGDRYVTQATDFTGDVQSFQGVLMDLQAAGGQDDPESLNQALFEAIHDMSWRGGETVQLIFLVADAPPHLDYPQDFTYSESLKDAVTMGIKVQPIASRLCEQRDTCPGERRAYQEQAEYIFRQMAQFTGGHFIFLTYEDTPQSSGEPGTESHVSEDQYSVADLDALVVRLITEELAALEGGQQ